MLKPTSAASRPSGETARHWVRSIGPDDAANSVPVAGSYRWMPASPGATARVLPSGANPTEP